MSRPVVVFGSVNLDLSVAVAHLPSAGETVIGGSILRSWGGKGANQAVAARRFGASVRLVGAVGDDDWAEPAITAIADEGVDARFIARAKASTGTALIMVDPNGENLIAVAAGANHQVTASMLEPALDGPPGLLLACLEIPLSAVYEGVEMALARGWKVILNPAPAARLGREWEALPLLITPNESEAAVVVGDGVRTLRADSCWTVVVTRGARGARVMTGGELTDVPAPEVDPVDSTGAGDSFNGVLAAEMASGAELVAAVRTAVTAASYSTERRGAREGMLSKEELRQHIATRRR